MSDKIFIDTNLWVYLYAKEPQTKYHGIKQLVDARFGDIVCSTQILGELYHVLIRKNFLAEEEAKKIIYESIATFSVASIEPAHVQEAITIHEQYRYSYWDSLVIATALRLDVKTLYSEDMQHNQLLSDTIRIVNPFY